MNLFDQANKIVVKIGSSFLIDSKTNAVQQTWLDSMVDDIVQLMKKNKKMAIVSSGSTALGCKMLNLSLQKAKLQEKQYASVCGQNQLMNLYQASFARHNINVAQILFTIEDIENRKRFLSIKQIIEQLMDNNIVPIINENDLIANTEIRFGDNDRLSGRVAQIVSADLLFMTSLIDGLYTIDPKIHPSAQLVSEVYEITSDIESMADDSIAKTGGMSAKVAAAKIALNNNCNVIFANGTYESPIKRIIEGANCTRFINNSNSTTKYKIG